MTDDRAVIEASDDRDEVIEAIARTLVKAGRPKLAAGFRKRAATCATTEEVLALALDLIDTRGTRL